MVSHLVYYYFWSRLENLKCHGNGVVAQRGRRAIPGNWADTVGQASPPRSPLIDIQVSGLIVSNDVI